MVDHGALTTGSWCTIVPQFQWSVFFVPVGCSGQPQLGMIIKCTKNGHDSGTEKYWRYLPLIYGLYKAYFPPIHMALYGTIPPF